ncbi:site-2 protease family protein [Sporosarcina sp. G11-34]|uniref:site-2 protease family protein n=1 Tax=Sporosarcina sp. G11-34 TaxID=2849605 RepID=UPI0022A99DF4|nr:site-2 protease family protein [Sporosarcina sp. G11-34]MCZ2258407.1 M50 family metallopeptidase [Sporosarcina sp. G11-34]
MKFRLHPVLLPVFLYLMIVGGLSVYVLVFISLLLHELGHLIAAKLTGMRVRSCIIMPYGGEIVIPGRLLAPKKDRLLVALGGPIATIILLLLSLFISFPGGDLFVRIQLGLLLLNLLPILPLDGGQALVALLETGDTKYNTRTIMIIYSILFLSAAIILLITHLPTTIPYILLAIFLLIQNISAFRYRKYEKAFIELKLKQLTK